MTQPITPRTIDRLVSALLFIKDNGVVIDGPEPFMEFEPGYSLSEDPEESKLMALRHLKTTRDALHAILNAVEVGINALQEPCVGIALQRGIRSIPEDVLALIFEVGYDGCDDPSRNLSDSHKFSFAVSHVSRHFRTIALGTPRIWTRLSNRMTSPQLEAFTSRSKAADLILTAICENRADSTMNLDAFLSLTVPHHARWSEFTYVTAMDEYLDHLSAWLSQTRYLTFPRLSRLRCEKYLSSGGADAMPPEGTFATWDMPALIHFHGINASIEMGSIGENVKSVVLKMNEGWNYLSFLQELESWPHLNSLDLEFSQFDSDIEPCKLSFRSLKTMVITGRSAAGRWLGRMLSLLDMPVLSKVSIKIHGHDEGVDDLIEGMVSAATRCLGLREFILDTTGVLRKQHRYRFGVLEMFVSRLSFLEKVIFRGPELYDLYQRPKPPLWQLFHIEGAESTDMGNIALFLSVAFRVPSFKLRMGKCGQCKGISVLKKMLGDRLEYDAV